MFNIKLKTVVTWLCIFVVASLFLPWLLTRSIILGISGPDFSSTGPIGDTIGGILGPVFSLVGAIITYLAFHTQYQANEELKKMQNLQSIENLFTQLLSIHRDNIRELSINGPRNLNAPTQMHTQRQALKQMTGELIYLINKLESVYKNIDKINIAKLAYYILYYGLNGHNNSQKLNKYFLELTNSKIDDILRTNEFPSTNTFHPSRQDDLSLYFQHLYRTIYFIHTHPNLNYQFEEKEKLVNILRDQLSNSELILIAANASTDIGKNFISSEILLVYDILKNFPQRGRELGYIYEAAQSQMHSGKLVIKYKDGSSSEPLN